MARTESENCVETHSISFQTFISALNLPRIRSASLSAPPDATTASPFWMREWWAER